MSEQRKKSRNRKILGFLAERSGTEPLLFVCLKASLHPNKEEPEILRFRVLGGDKRDRTADLLNAIQALSQLSYTPIELVRTDGTNVILAGHFPFVNQFFRILSVLSKETPLCLRSASVL
jgi:hypothetical protein